MLNAKELQFVTYQDLCLDSLYNLTLKIKVLVNQNKKYKQQYNVKPYLGYRQYKQRDDMHRCRGGPGPTPWNLWNRKKNEQIKDDPSLAGIYGVQK